MSAQYIWKLSWLLGLLTYCKHANLPWNFVTAASINNILKLPGVLRSMLRKTGKQQCKIPDVPSEDHGNWGWECDGLFYRVFALREECRVLWRITPYTFISPKMTIFFGTVRSMATMRIANVRIHFERAIRRIKVLHIFDGVIPLSLWSCQSTLSRELFAA